jgi:hypothetical protein
MRGQFPVSGMEHSDMLNFGIMVTALPLGQKVTECLTGLWIAGIARKYSATAELIRGPAFSFTIHCGHTDLSFSNAA